MLAIISRVMPSSTALSRTSGPPRPRGLTTLRGFRMRGDRCRVGPAERRIRPRRQPTMMMTPPTPPSRLETPTSRICRPLIGRRLAKPGRRRQRNRASSPAMVEPWRAARSRPRLWRLGCFTRNGDEGRCRRPRAGLRRVSRQAHQRVAQVIAADVLQRLSDAALDARIAAAFAEDATSGDAASLLAEVKEAASAAELAAEAARKHALDPLLSGGDLKVARRGMEDTSFLRDRLTEAASRLGERVADLKALEADGRT